MIWAGFGPVGSGDKKKLARLSATLEDVFSCFHWRYFFSFEYCIGSIDRKVIGVV